jgi:NTE family protein
MLAAVEALRVFPTLYAMLMQIDADRLVEIESELELSGITSGTALFNEGDAAVEAFILVRGRLGVFVGSNPDAPPIAEVSPGEIVGEMGLLSQEPRSATVIALRDCDLVRLPQQAFDLITESSPQISRLLMKLLAKRLERTSHSSVVSRATQNVAVVPATGAAVDPQFVPLLAEAFTAMGRRVETIDHDSRHLEADRLELAAEEHGLVLYIADGAASEWGRQCIRQSDTVLFIAASDSRRAESTAEAVAYARGLRRKVELVLLNPSDRVLPAGGASWLDLFSCDRILHTRIGVKGDLARLARFVLRLGVGLVFSGGGARGFAHLGVYKAFTDSGIAVDLVGGTSMGAVVGALVAQGLTPETIAEKMRHAFVRNNPFNDYTLPIVSLVRGRRMTSLIKYHFGEARIEDMWKTYFCVSTNLSSGTLNVHRDGSLWHGLRASGAVPGLLPPAVIDGQILVDGGLMDNFPTGIMRTLARGPVVGVDVSSGSSFECGVNDIESKSLYWMLVKGRKQVPGMLKILMRSGTVNGEIQSIASRAAADVLIHPELSAYDILAWQSFDTIVELGYKAGLEAIRQHQSLLTGEWAKEATAGTQ